MLRLGESYFSLATANRLPPINIIHYPGGRPTTRGGPKPRRTAVYEKAIANAPPRAATPATSHAT